MGNLLCLAAYHFLSDDGLLKSIKSNSLIHTKHQSDRKKFSTIIKEYLDIQNSHNNKDGELEEEKELVRIFKRLYRILINKYFCNNL